MTEARAIHVRGVVQGVGFRPHVYRSARARGLAGWVLNQQDGVRIHVEGEAAALDDFLSALRGEPPPAAAIRSIDVQAAAPAGYPDFTIGESLEGEAPSTSMPPDLPVCDECLEELFDPADRRCGYPYLNCTQCGPRFSVIEALPYDRAHTTMRAWPLDEFCASQYHDPSDRRFHAQPVACPACGPHYFLKSGEAETRGDAEAVGAAARLLEAGGIVAVKGLGGYHLACDARRAEAVAALRERKFRKEKPFALMGRDLEVVQGCVQLSAAALQLLQSPARPIVLAPARARLDGVAPGSPELGVMLPYTPLHHLLFAAGAPELLVMTSANRSSEPIAYRDEDALARLEGLADAFLIGERPIARRVDDSVARHGPFGPLLLRRSRGYAPGAVAALPDGGPILAVGADLKNTVTLVVDGQAFVSQHIGDLGQSQSLVAFRETIDDLLAMYRVRREALTVVADAHPQYRSGLHAATLAAACHGTVQHHRAHVASVLAERQAHSEPVAGVAFDGTGYGEDGVIWGGEVFVGSLKDGLQRAAHLRPALLAGGDAAARHPVQAAAGFLCQLPDAPDFQAEPFDFPARFDGARQLLARRLRTFPTTSMGRLFDVAAALLGFTREITFEGQAAIWLQHGAATGKGVACYPFPFAARELDFRPLLGAVIADRLAGRDPAQIAYAFHAGVARGLGLALGEICRQRKLGTVVLSGGVFQNTLLLELLRPRLEAAGLRVWTNRLVPPNDGGISLGQAALAAFGRWDAAPGAPSEVVRQLDPPTPPVGSAK